MIDNMYSQKALHAVQWDGTNIKDIDTFCQECGYHYGNANQSSLGKNIVLESNDYKHTVLVHLNDMLYYKGDNHKLHAMDAKKFKVIHLRDD